MRFVLANRHMKDIGGTETHLVTIGDQLLRLGHEVVVYSPELGASSDHAQRFGIDVVDRLRELPEECDVVLAQDSIVVHEVASRYPRALTTFRICGDTHDFQTPPQVEGLVDLLVVLSDRYERFARSLAVRVPVLRLRLPVDVNRLKPIGELRVRPQRAAVLGNYPDRVQAVREAWEELGIGVEQIGGTRQRYDIAAALGGVDIVVAKSRAALDAMSCGRAVYVYDLFGGDGWVTPEIYAALEADHFAGLATDRVIDVAALAGDLAAYDPGMGAANRDLVVQHHSAREHVIEYLAAIGDRDPVERSSGSSRELGRLTALQWSWERLAYEAQHAQVVANQRRIAAEQATAEASAVAAHASDAAAAASAEVAAASAEATEASAAARRAADEAAEATEAASRAAAAAEVAERDRAAAVTRASAAAAAEAELEAIHRSRLWALAHAYWRVRARAGRARERAGARRSRAA